jgi:hypothetical protein
LAGHTYDPGTQGAEAGQSQVWGQPGKQMRSCLNKEEEEKVNAGHVLDHEDSFNF